MLLRDTRQWAAALSFIDGLPPQVREMPTIREQRALALSKNGQHSEAIAELEALIRAAGDSSERSGLIGGRYKALYEAAADAPTRSRYLNSAITSYQRGMMLDLNDYYPASNLPRLYRERNLSDDETKAMSAARLTVVACERAMQRNPNDPWIRPTLLGAAFDAGDVPKARKLLDEFNQAATAPFQLESTIPDLRTGAVSAGVPGDVAGAGLNSWRLSAAARSEWNRHCSGGKAGRCRWARKIAASHPRMRRSCRSVSATCWWQRRAPAWFRRQLAAQTFLRWKPQENLD